MDPLEKLEEELYGKEKEDAEDIKKRITRSPFSEEPGHFPPPFWSDKDEPSRDKPKITSRKLMKALLWIGLVIIIAGGVVFSFFYLGVRGQEAEVVIEGRDNIEAGELVTVSIKVSNISRVELKEAELVITLPERVYIKENDLERPAPARLVKKISDIGAWEERIEEMQLRFFGREEENKLIEASLFYRPSNLRARFSANAARLFTIRHVPLAISWEVPEHVTQEQEVELKIHYISDARSPVEDLSFQMEYPGGFTFKSAEPAPSVENTLWNVGTLTPGREGVITIRGVVSGEEDEVKAFRAGIGLYTPQTKAWVPYSESNREVRIAGAPLSVRSYLGGLRDYVITPGERLSFSVRYQNNTNATLKNVTVRTFLQELSSSELAELPKTKTSQDRVLEFALLSIESGGVFDALTNSIVWAPASIESLRELEPGENGSFSLIVSTHARPLMRSSRDRNIVVRLHTIIEAAGIPKEFAGIKIGSEDVALFKVKSRVLFDGRAVYRSSPIANSGPLPPKVGSPTTYAIVFEIRNFTNDIKDAEILARIPPNIKWQNVVSPKNILMTYDESSGEIRWRIGTLPSGTGVIAPAFVGAFQISFTPSEVDVEHVPFLVNESRFIARDAFTDTAVEEKLDGFTIELHEDPGTAQTDWRVVK